ncbi:MAG: hypothetical protein DHS20C15_14160 [Planctomycetota bacterium]|nr:MAG: hypothetical protein DHS20C15_14160 [Planctomycetota bacterium]
MDGLLLSGVLGLAGLVLWRLRVRDELPGTPPDRDGRGLIGLFVLGFLILRFSTQAFLSNTGVPHLEDLTVVQTVSALSAGNAVTALALLLLVRRHPSGRGALGMTAQAQGSPWLAGLCAYLLAIPVIALLTQVNFALAPLYLGEAAEQELVQGLLRAFIEEGARSSATAWIAMGIVIPFAEELLFRGALYGGLRYRLGPWRAAFFSGLIFAVIHLDPAHILPLTGLGILLAWIYERTGSLAAPALVHILNNLVTLAVQSTLSPEDLT